MAKQSVLKLQKRAARIILNADRKSFSVTLLNRLNWLPFYKESLIKRNVLVYKRVKDGYSVPRYIREILLVRNCDVHGRGTRYNYNFNLVTYKYKRETEGGRTFAVKTAKQWNALKVALRSQTSVGCFKRAFFKDHLDEQKAVML